MNNLFLLNIIKYFFSNIEYIIKKKFLRILTTFFFIRK